MPDLFCATAQIRFPSRRPPRGDRQDGDRPTDPEEFPVRCDEPLPGEDLTYVLYGSGGCSLYDAARLRALGGVDRGLRARLRGRSRPRLSRLAARLAQRLRGRRSRRAPPSRHHVALLYREQLDRILEINYLKFLARAVSSRKLFRRLWLHAIRRLRARAAHDPAARSGLSWAASIALRGGPTRPSSEPEDGFLALTGGAVAVFPGHGPAPSKPPALLVVRPSLAPAPRAGDAGQVLVAFTRDLQTPPPELLSVYAEVVLVHRRNGDRRHLDPAFRAALRQTMRKWPIRKVRLETREMEAYLPDCAHTEIILT